MIDTTLLPKPGFESASSYATFDETIESLKHIDLSGLITRQDKDRTIYVKRGGYGIVSTGYLRQGDREFKVAIKELSIRIQGSGSPVQHVQKYFVKELKNWVLLEHPNVLHLLGFCVENGFPLLISAWMENGTVVDYINAHPECDVTSMILGIAKGLEYLHGKGMVHSDLKADNVLVDNEGAPRICDFGISNAITVSQTISSGSENRDVKGTLHFMSIELFDFSNGQPHHSRESDIWAFGMTIHELLAQELPFSSIANNPSAVMIAIMQYRLPEPPRQYEDWPKRLQQTWDTCRLCWAKNPKERILISNIVGRLESIMALTDSEMESNISLMLSKVESGFSFKSILAELEHVNLTQNVRFKSSSIHAHGQYADIFEGTATLAEISSVREVKVALKRPRSDFAKANAVAKEIVLWSTLTHQRLLAFLGYVWEGEGYYPLLVSEWMKNGTAKAYIMRNPSCNISDMILGIAEGLAYLHSENVVHGDMKADNVLVSDNGEPQICDFGSARVLPNVIDTPTPYGLEVGGTLRWMAIELLEPAHPPMLNTYKSDVWAFGMTAYELISRQLPYAHIKLDPQVFLEIVNGGLPTLPKTLTDSEKAIWDLCCFCWAKIPESRPDMAFLVLKLTNLAADSLESALDHLEDKFKALVDFRLPEGLIYPHISDIEEGDHRIQSIFKEVNHLDFSGKVRYDTENKRVSAGYEADVFVGFTSLIQPTDTYLKEVKIAVKKLRVYTHNDQRFLLRLLKRIKIWATLDHSNVLPFLGYTIEDGIYPLLITPWMESGTSISYVQANPNCNIIHMILGIAEGLLYLHGQDIVHGSLKGTNVLISADEQPRICDFGIASLLVTSEDLASTSSANKVGRNVRWMATELLANSSEDEPSVESYTQMSDVWSFGMTAYELTTKDKPYSQFRDYTVIFNIAAGKLPKEPRNLRTLPEDAQERELWKLCQNCWECEPTERPSMQEVVCALDAMQRYKCKTCSKEFKRKAEFDSHMPIHDPNRLKVFVCYCEQEFLTKDDLRHHMKMDHTS